MLGLFFLSTASHSTLENWINILNASPAVGLTSLLKVPLRIGGENQVYDCTIEASFILGVHPGLDSSATSS